LGCTTKLEKVHHRDHRLCIEVLAHNRRVERVARVQHQHRGAVRFEVLAQCSQARETACGSGFEPFDLVDIIDLQDLE
jgi:hypothetical protein